MSTRVKWLLGIIAALVAGLIAWWWFTTYERVPVLTPNPRTGEARYNPYYALKKTLQARGLEVESRANLTLDTAHLHPGDVLVLGVDARAISTTQAFALHQWVERGGHLIFAVPPNKQGTTVPLMASLGIAPVTHVGCVKLKLDLADAGRDYCASNRFKLVTAEEEQFDWLWGAPEHGYLMGRAQLGEGDWFVAGQLRALTTSQLRRKGHAELVWRILGPVLGDGKVYLIYATDAPPLHVLLVREGWPILLPLVLALFAWLWWRSQRLGPLLPLAPPDRRALLEHVRAAGEFSFWRGRAIALHAALLRSYMERLRRREPRIAALEGELLIAALAERYQRDPAEISQALFPPEVTKPERFVATIRTLMELKAKP